MFSNPIESVFRKLTQQLNEPAWLIDKRNEALKQYQTLGTPGRKSELWKYTDVKLLQKLPPAEDLADNKEYFVFTIQSELPKDLRMQNLQDIQPDDWQDIEVDKDRVFVSMNTAMLNGGFQLDIPANAQLKLHIQYQQISPDWQNIRTVINIGENAHLDLTESYDYNCRINHVSIINAADSSKIKLQSHKLLSKTSALLHYSQINCQSKVTIQQCTTNNNSRLAHSIQDVDFNGEGCNFKSASINVVHDQCHISENILTRHKVPNCKSEVIKRSLATDKGSVSVNAKAIVSVAADGSDISQSLKNILVSEDARIYSRPELEINTDDVVAAHGSTIGELDDTALNYLRSRGIQKEQAELMLMESFLQQANIFKNEDFLDRIEL